MNFTADDMLEDAVLDFMALNAEVELGDFPDA